MFKTFQTFLLNTQARTNQEEIPISTLAQVSQMSLEAASLPPQSYHQSNLLTLHIIQIYLLYTPQLSRESFGSFTAAGNMLQLRFATSTRVIV